MLLTVPNMLSLSRIFVIPALVATFYWTDPWSNWVALALFSAAGITDFFDGWLARRSGQVSKLGQFLDPVADKLMVVAAIIMLIDFERLRGFSVLAALVIVCREITVSGLREFLAEIKVGVPVSVLAKWKTTVQMVALGFLLVGDAAPKAVPAELIGTVGLWIAAVLTLYTGYDYLITGIRHMR